jgi:hypothetical protein
MSIVDVAPLMVYQLDLPIPESLEGRLVTEALEAHVLSVRPPRHEAATVAVASVGDVALDAEAEAEILDRLRALGYVE